MSKITNPCNICANRNRCFASSCYGGNEYIREQELFEEMKETALKDLKRVVDKMENK